MRNAPKGVELVGALLPRVLRRVGLESMPAMVRAEVDSVTVVDERGRCVGRLDLHATHRIERIAAPAAQALTIPVGPVEESKEGKEDDVEVGRVVPLEVDGGDGGGPGGGNGAERTEDPLGDQARC